MNTIESTVAMMEVLPEADLLKIQSFTLKLFEQKRTNCPFPLKSREDIYRDLEISRKQAAAGEYQEMGEAIDERYTNQGLCVIK